MYGIDKLKEATLVAINVGQGFAARMEDGKFTWVELIGFVPTLWSIKDIFTNAKIIWLQIKDLDDAEKIEINEFVKANVELEDEGLEVKIEKSFAWLIATGDLILEFVKKDEGDVEA